jgi:hypothetical protein
MATPEQYFSTFELWGDGQQVLDDLVQQFCGPVFDQNPYEMARRAGRREVIEHIHAQIAKVDKPPRKA